MKLINLIQGSPEWIAHRLNCVCASDIAPIMGIKGAFSNRNALMQEKLGKVRELSGFQKNMFAAGHEWEKLVLNHAALDIYKLKPAVVEYDEDPRFMASLDGIDVEHEIILEVKSVTNNIRFEMYCKETPAHYMAQVQWQMFCSGYKKALIAFVFDGTVEIKMIEYDQLFIVQAKLAAYEFLKELDAIKAGTSVAKIQTLPPSVMADDIKEFKRMIKERKNDIERMEDDIKLMAEILLGQNNAVKLENDEISIQWIERQGSVQYKNIPELKNVDLDAYRGKSSKYISVKLKGESE